MVTVRLTNVMRGGRIVMEISIQAVNPTWRPTRQTVKSVGQFVRRELRVLTVIVIARRAQSWWTGHVYPNNVHRVFNVLTTNVVK